MSKPKVRTRMPGRDAPCSRCGVSRDVAKFWKNSGYCTDCSNAKRREQYRKQNPLRADADEAAAAKRERRAAERQARAEEKRRNDERYRALRESRQRKAKGYGAILHDIKPPPPSDRPIIAAMGGDIDYAKKARGGRT